MTRDLLVALLKMLCPGPLLKTLTLTLTKNCKKYEHTIFLLMASGFYDSNLQKQRHCLIEKTYKSKSLFIINCHFDQVSFRSNLVSIKCHFDQALFRTSVVSIKCHFN